MKIKIILDNRKNTLNAEGFPVVIRISEGNNRKLVKTGFRAHPKQWDAVNAVPLTSHPQSIDFLNYLHPIKLAIARALIAAKSAFPGEITVSQVYNEIFGSKSTGFYKETFKLVPGGNNRHIYASALNSFNRHFPHFTYKQITQDVAKQYLANISLETTNTGAVRSPNGCHTYMRTLTALWNKTSKETNPFSGVRPKKVVTASKVLSNADVYKIQNTEILTSKYDGRSNSDTVQLNRYYWLLMFYLGGINMKVLAGLRYDKHLVNGRIEFKRDKGGTDERCNNKVFKEARVILDKINELTNCKPYFTPIHRQSDYNGFVGNYNKRFAVQCEPMNLTRKPLTVSARYTFINRAKQLGLNERITMEIVGHSSGGTHGIYTDEFTLKVRDKAHKKIIRLT